MELYIEKSPTLKDAQQSKDKRPYHIVVNASLWGNFINTIPVVKTQFSSRILRDQLTFQNEETEKFLHAVQISKIVSM